MKGMKRSCENSGKEGTRRRRQTRLRKRHLPPTATRGTTTVEKSKEAEQECLVAYPTSERERFRPPGTERSQAPRRHLENDSKNIKGIQAMETTAIQECQEQGRQARNMPGRKCEVHVRILLCRLLPPHRPSRRNDHRRDEAKSMQVSVEGTNSGGSTCRAQSATRHSSRAFRNPILCMENNGGKRGVISTSSRHHARVLGDEDDTPRMEENTHGGATQTRRHRPPQKFQGNHGGGNGR